MGTVTLKAPFALVTVSDWLVDFKITVTPGNGPVLSFTVPLTEISAVSTLFKSVDRDLLLITNFSAAFMMIVFS